MSAMYPVVELAEHVMGALVEHPEDLRVTGIDGARCLVLEVRCNKEDIGILIGKNGKTVSALRVLLTAMVSRQNRRVMLEIMD